MLSERWRRLTLGCGDAEVLPDGGNVLIREAHNILQVLLHPTITFIQHLQERSHGFWSVGAP